MTPLPRKSSETRELYRQIFKEIDDKAKTDEKVQVYTQNGYGEFPSKLINQTPEKK